MSKNKSIRIATRKSPLALRQAEFVKQQLSIHYPDWKIDFIELVTTGDRFLSSALYEKGGKGLFVKELEQALLEGRADLAVHSMKDVPAKLPDELGMIAICERDDPRDVFVSQHFQQIAELPQGAIVGTASLRRTSQLRALRPDVEIKLVRGNVNTRLNKLEQDEYDALILAYAGLKRLQLETHIKQILEPEVFLPAVGQGALGIECRLDNQFICDALQVLNHEPTAYCIAAERAMNKRLGGGCHVPVAGYAIIENNTQLYLRGLVASVDSQKIIYDEIRGSINEAEKLGQELAERLFAKDAKDLLSSFI